MLERLELTIVGAEGPPPGKAGKNSVTRKSHYRISHMGYAEVSFPHQDQLLTVIPQVESLGNPA